MIKKRLQTLKVMARRGEIGTILRKAWFYLLHCDRFYIMAIGHGQGTSQRPPDPADIRLATPADLGALEELTGDSGYELGQTMRSGNLCLVAEREGHPVAIRV